MVAVETLKLTGKPIVKSIAWILELIPISFGLDFSIGDKIDMYLPMSNLGSYNGVGYNTYEDLAIYAPNIDFKYNGGVCTIKFPILFIISR